MEKEIQYTAVCFITVRFSQLESPDHDNRDSGQFKVRPSFPGGAQ